MYSKQFPICSSVSLAPFLPAKCKADSYIWEAQLSQQTALPVLQQELPWSFLSMFCKLNEQAETTYKRNVYDVP